jgi:hypothetical protein
MAILSNLQGRILKSKFIVDSQSKGRIRLVSMYGDLSNLVGYQSFFLLLGAKCSKVPAISHIIAANSGVI